MSHSLSADRRRTATKTVKSGFGDQGGSEAHDNDQAEEAVRLLRCA